MKKLLSVVLSSALIFGLIVPTTVGAEAKQEQKVKQEYKKEKIGNSIHAKIGDVEVELVGVIEESPYEDEALADETLSLIAEHLENEKEKKTKGDISIMQEEIGGSGGRLAGVYPNDFLTNTWSNIQPAIKYAVGTGITLGMLSLGTDPVTAIITGGFAGGVADVIAASLAPEYTNTFYLYDYSSYYGKTIYKQVTYIYYEKARVNLKAIKVSSPLEKVSINGSFTLRAVR